MENYFKKGMKISLNNEFGVVVDESISRIRWDSSKESDFEDWFGMFGSFVEIGGKILEDDYVFKYIDNNGNLIKMKEILVATHNLHKKEEIQQILGEKYKITSLTDYNIHDEIIEDGNSFHENALIKAKFCFEKTGKPSLGDDSGLVVPALDGRPGIFSARYAGDHDFDKNIEKVLEEMQNEESREAYFITVLCLHDENSTHYFEGRVYGNLSKERSGKKGFGYDPIFIPKGYEISFADMLSEEKNAISHRKNALDKFLQFLEK